MARKPMLGRSRAFTGTGDWETRMQELYEKPSWERTAEENEAVDVWSSQKGMHFGPTRGGAQEDWRTDQYLENAAKSGELAKQNLRDARSRMFMATFGSGGPLSNDWQGDPEIRRQVLDVYMPPNDMSKWTADPESMHTTARPWDAAVYWNKLNKARSGKSTGFRGPLNISQANAAIRKMTRG